MIITVAALQYPLGMPIRMEDLLHLVRRRPDVVCLPEYFGVSPDARSHDDGIESVDSQLDYFARLSRELGCTVIGGTLVHPQGDGYGNIATVFDQGHKIGFYQKANPTEHERQRGILSGDEYKVFEVNGVRIGVLICADVLTSDSFVTMAELGADVIFAPTVSPYKSNDTVFEKDRRDKDIFVAGAQTSCAYVVKTCGIGTIFGHPLQGRSGIFAPWGILKRVMPDSEDRKLLLTESLDINEIREFRSRMAESNRRPAGVTDRLTPVL